MGMGESRGTGLTPRLTDSKECTCSVAGAAMMAAFGSYFSPEAQSKCLSLCRRFGRTIFPTETNYLQSF